MAPKSLLIVSDWDETITCHDTLRLVAPISHELPQDTKPFAHYEQVYNRETENFRTEFGPIQNDHQLSAFVKEVRQVELTTMNEIISGGLFRGTKRSDRSSRAKEVVFQNGWQDFQEFLHSCEQRIAFKIAFHILSVNWSRRFILDALLAAEGKQHCVLDHAELDRAGVTEIHANEIEVMDDTEKSTGRIIGPYPDGRLLLTGEDKRQVLRSILGNYPTRPITLYAGDSMHDLACMLEADVGIVMGQNASLRAKLQGIESAVNIIPASEWHIALSKNLALSPNLVQVDSWLEVISIIQALHKHGYI